MTDLDKNTGGGRRKQATFEKINVKVDGCFEVCLVMDD